MTKADIEKVVKREVIHFHRHPTYETYTRVYLVSGRNVATYVDFLTKELEDKIKELT